MTLALANLRRLGAYCALIVVVAFVVACGGSPAATSTATTPASNPTTPANSPTSAATGTAGTDTGAGASKYPEIKITNKPDVVRVAYQAIPNSERLARGLGMHEKTLGTKITWTQFDSGRDVNTAMASGAIDIGLVGSTPAAAGIARGLNYDVVAIYDVIGKNEALVAKPDIGSFANLKGKKVAAPFGSTTHFSLLKALDANKINANDVQIIDMQPPDMLAAWTRGDIDAGYVWHPTLQKMYDSGGKPLVTSAELAEQGIVTADVMVVSRDFSSKYPEVVAAYLQDLSKATDMYNSDPDAAADVMAKEFGLKKEEILPQMKDLIWLTSEQQIAPEYFGTKDAPGRMGQILKDTADFLVTQKVIENAPDLATFQKGANPTFLQQSVGK